MFKLVLEKTEEPEIKLPTSTGSWKKQATAAKSLQSCPTLCDSIDGSPPGSPVPGILQARPLEWGAISFSNLWKWKWSHSVMSDSYRPHGLQPTRLLHPWDFPGKSTGVGCHCLLWYISIECIIDTHLLSINLIYYVYLISDEILNKINCFVFEIKDKKACLL